MPGIHERAEALLERELERFERTHPRSGELARRASASLIAGVPMHWMVRWPGAYPVFAEEAWGARFRDVDGIEYVDFCLGDTGAMTGHSPEPVVRAVAEQAARGITLMLPSEEALWAGEELTRRFGLARWQFALTATDANRFAIRLARHVTGRPKVLVFNWCYHGTVDESFATLHDGRVVEREANIGPPVALEETTRVVEWNDPEGLRRELEHGDVACVLAEPALTNIGIVLPEPGFHDALRSVTRDTGTLLVVDETHTICAGPGGCTAAWGLEPDLLVIGKTIGGGVPAAAYGLSAEVAEGLHGSLFAEDVDVSGVGGTLTGSALAIAAVRATLSSTLTAADFERTIPLAGRWAGGVQDAISAHGLPWTVQQLGCRAEYWFCPPPRDGAAAAAAVDAELDAFMHLWALNRGVLLTPFHNMALLCPHHRAEDVDRHTAVFRAAVEALVA
jgi:glutamate-1-semialdehyde 2,1-aminomutase